MWLLDLPTEKATSGLCWHSQSAVIGNHKPNDSAWLQRVTTNSGGQKRVQLVSS